MEEWRVINGFTNYSVSNLGNVRNNKTNKLMKLNIKGGYNTISLINNNLKKSFKVHRLVASAFIENPENKKTVNHKNKNKLDNTIWNLEWATMEEQAKHKSMGLIYKSNKNKRVNRIDNKTGELLEKYNSIEEAGEWVFKNNYTNNSHNGRNAIGNCINGLSKTAYGFKWEHDEIKEINNEEWSEININKLFNSEINLDKKYYISNLGRFKNSYGVIMDNYKTNVDGYIHVYIYNRTFALHRLVALTFLENSANKKTVNHKDGNKLNNCVDNLEFATNQEQQIHKIQNGLGNNFTRKVVQYDLEWNFIKEHNSITNAAKEVNISKGSIQGVLLGNRKTAAKYIWKYSDDENIDFTQKITINKNIGRNVGQYDKDMNLIKIHNSIADAARNVNINKNNIWAVIKNNKNTAGGFVWKYLD